MVLSAVLLVIALLALADWLWKRHKSLYPQPGFALPFLGHAYLLGDLTMVHKTLHRLAETCGRKPFSLWMMGQQVVVAPEPEYLKPLNAVARTRNGMKDSVPFAVGLTGMPAGPKHSALRKFFHPFINSQTLQHLQEPTMLRHCEKLCGVLRELARTGEAFDAQNTMEWATFDLGMEFVFGFDPDALRSKDNELRDEWRVINEHLLYRVMTKDLPYWKWPMTKTAFWRRYDASVARVNALMVQAVRRCKEECAAHPDKPPTSALEYYLLSERDATCELSEEELVGQCLNLVWGSVDSTRVITTFSVAEAFLHSKEAAAVRAELDQALGDAPFPSAKQLLDLPQLECWVREVLRVYPPFGFSPSHLNESVQVGSVLVPSGVEVWNPIWSLHQSPAWGKDVADFCPQRWVEKRAATAHFEPFGGGSRRCPGERLGQMDVRFLVAAMLRHFDFELVDASAVGYILKGAACNKGPLMTRVAERK